MADDYEELVELGFEGVDRFATKFHDPVVDFANKTFAHPHWHSNKRKSREPSSGHKSRRARSASFDRKRRDSAAEQPPEAMYEERVRDDSASVYQAGPRSRDKDRDYYAEDTTMIVRGRDGRDPFYRGGYEVAPRIPRDEVYGNRGFVERQPERWDDRGRAGPQQSWQRSMSYSPPRQPRSPLPPPRQRSRSPNHHRVAATIIGALAGGLLGNAAKHGSTASTVGGAVIGGIAAREGEKWYDRHEEKKFEHEERPRRRRDRDREYYY